MGGFEGNWLITCRFSAFFLVVSIKKRTFAEKFGFNYTYLEHNELLDESEMQSLKYYGWESSMKYKELFELNK